MPKQFFYPCGHFEFSKGDGFYCKKCKNVMGELIQSLPQLSSNEVNTLSLLKNGF